MGNSIQFLSEHTRLIASDENWIEGEAIQQLTHVATLKGMAQVVGLPDLHPGRGYPIGAACFSNNMIYPALVGNDIGCGMSLVRTDLLTRKVKLDKLENKLRTSAFSDQLFWSDHGLSLLQQALATDGLSTNPDHSDQTERDFIKSIGTIGGGNHFAEFQKISKVVDQSRFDALGLDSAQLYLLVHSGSRGLGESILRQHVDQFGHQGLAADSEEAQAYMRKHDFALRWAEVNRSIIAARMLSALNRKLVDLDNRSSDVVLDVNHNLVSQGSFAGDRGWIHRKGATPADQGVVMIPGSRGSISYLVQPKACEVSLYSLAHGAGRKWVRTECEARLKSRFTRKALERTKLGSRVICDDKALLYEEAPEAYKAVDVVVSDLVEANLVDVIAEFSPVLTFKTLSSKATGSKSEARTKSPGYARRPGGGKCC
ncbi:RNA ligase RtcB family protein [Litoribacillus peritrichatus]|uniref:tRNA-splicing ligase RtcB n=1 Tax=Litoribacillus peritrichatus TaxID=718191 RepID=A0ABP7N0M2_9GAMM